MVYIFILIPNSGIMMVKKKGEERTGLFRGGMRSFLLADNKESWNKSKYFIRATKDGQQGIKDLTLLAQTLPEERQNKVFTRENLEPMIKEVLQYDLLEIALNNGEDFPPNSRRLQIAVMMVQLGIDVCRGTIPSGVGALGARTIEDILMWMAGLDSRPRML